MMCCADFFNGVEGKMRPMFPRSDAVVCSLLFVNNGIVACFAYLYVDYCVSVWNVAAVHVLLFRHSGARYFVFVVLVLD